MADSDEARPTAQPEFRLSPEEDWIFGVKMRGSVLSFGPSGSEVAMASLVCLMMAAIGAFMAFSAGSLTLNGHTVRNPTAVEVTGGLVLAFATGFLVATLFVGVRAEEQGVVLRRPWRRRHLPWGDIREIRSQETVPHRWTTFISTNSISLRMRHVPSWSVGLVELIDGSVVRLPGFNAPAREDGLSLGLPTATELKVQALTRFRTSITGEPASAPPHRPNR